MTLHRAMRSSPRQQAVEDHLVDHALIGSGQTARRGCTLSFNPPQYLQGFSPNFDLPADRIINQ
jgi:hypothetical protein